MKRERFSLKDVFKVSHIIENKVGRCYLDGFWTEKPIISVRLHSYMQIAIIFHVFLDQLLFLIVNVDFRNFTIPRIYSWELEAKITFNQKNRAFWISNFPRVRALHFLMIRKMLHAQVVDENCLSSRESAKDGKTGGGVLRPGNVIPQMELIMVELLIRYGNVSSVFGDIFCPSFYLSFYPPEKSWGVG